MERIKLGQSQRDNSISKVSGALDHVLKPLSRLRSLNQSSDIGVMFQTGQMRLFLLKEMKFILSQDGI